MKVRYICAIFYLRSTPPSFMSIVLIFLSVLLIFFLFVLSGEGGPYTKTRVAFILSLVTNALLVFIFNESASIFNALHATSAILFWSFELLAVVALLCYWHFKGKIDLANLTFLADIVKLKQLSRPNRIILLIGFVVFILPLFFLSIYSPPNNFDAHSYHLNRVQYWINNQNLDHFPTVHIQQLYLNVFAEYLVLDTVLLSGSDYFAGLIQFGAFLGSLAGVSLIARKMGMKADGQILAAVFLMTLPIGIFESTSAQVDYVACFFFISFVYFGHELLVKRSALTLLAFLFSLALGGFTKYTIFIFAFPFTVYFAFRILLEYKIWYAVKVLLLAVVILSFVFSFFFQRNYALFGHIMSPPTASVFFAEKLPVDKYSFLFTLSGLVKNAGLHLGLPNEMFNTFIYTKITDFHKSIGVGIDDLGLRLDAFAVRFSVHEDMVPNTVHFYTILLFTGFLFFLKSRWQVKWLWICSLAGIVLFCTLLKFQLWSTRTHMPFFAMGGIATAYIYSEYLKWKISYLLLPVMMLSSVFVLSNPNKQLVPVGYITKKIIGHIPVAFCIKDERKAKKFERELGSYYSFSGHDDCHTLTAHPGYRERLRIFSILDQEGYYDQEKFSTVFSMKREEAYFLSHSDDYADFQPLLEQLAGTDQNVGVLFGKGNGFYHYWSSIAVRGAVPGQMKYIRYRKEFASLPNARAPYAYKYILSDDLQLIQRFIPTENIEQIYHSRNFHLVKLRRESTDVDLY
jgi:hypothetical protein